MPNDYHNLVETLTQLSTRSARFRRVVLHTHTPMSHDFGERECDRALNEKSQYLKEDGEYDFLRYLTGNFDVVGITDHMRIGFGCRLCEAAKTKGNLLILPGVEINLRLAPPLHELRLHVIAVFDENKTMGEIERIFPDHIRDDDNRDGFEEIVVGPDEDFPDLASFVKRIEKSQGICIAAHLDSKKGIRYLFRQTGKDILELFNSDGKVDKEQERELSEKFKDFLIAARFHGIEVSKQSDRKHYVWESSIDGQKIEIPVVLTFDAHRIEDLCNVKRATYIKMTELSWQGLREAIKFPATRIRFSNDRVPPPRILGIEILSTSDQGFFPDLKIGFSENLTCVIGPRGAGKSLIIDSIRYVFGLNRRLEELESDDLKNAVLSRQKVNLTGCIIRVLYQLPDESTCVLEATYDSKSDYVTKVFDVDGNSVPVDDVDASGFYPLRLFGWSEIETLGRDPKRQLDLLDKQVDCLKAILEEKKQVINRLSENRQQIGQVITKLHGITNRDGQEIRKYKEYKREFERLNTPAVQQLFVELDQNREYSKFISKSIKIIDTVKEQIEKVQVDELDEIFHDGETSDRLHDWWLKLNTEISAKDDTVEIKKQLEEANKGLEELKNKVILVNASIEREIRKIEGEIRGKVSADPSKQVLTDLRNQAKERLDRAEKLKDEYNEVYEELEDLIKKRNGYIIQLLQCHRRISRLRLKEKNDIANKLNEFQTDDMQISLEFTKDGNRENLREFLGTTDWLKEANRYFKSKKWPEIITEFHTPVSLSHTILRKRKRLLVRDKEIEEKNYQINQGEAEDIVREAFPFDFDELADVDVVDWSKLESILKLQEVDWDDRERILRNGQPVDTASPGQRSSAMLPLIALAESVPLIIDQPEDNLDNRLVGKVLVDILSKLKEKRQIIVSTHNPNIVVLGDAEQVIVLDAINDKQGRVDCQASIDDPGIIRNVIELMEGGKEAFETRNKRYQGR